MPFKATSFSQTTIEHLQTLGACLSFLTFSPFWGFSGISKVQGAEKKRKTGLPPEEELVKEGGGEIFLPPSKTRKILHSSPPSSSFLPIPEKNPFGERKPHKPLFLCTPPPPTQKNPPPHSSAQHVCVSRSVPRRPIIQARGRKRTRDGAARFFPRGRDCVTRKRQAWTLPFFYHTGTGRPN